MSGQSLRRTFRLFISYGCREVNNTSGLGWLHIQITTSLSEIKAVYTILAKRKKEEREKGAFMDPLLLLSLLSLSPAQRKRK
jgi:hypothetical protein